jgi:hypothetical protein
MPGGSGPSYGTLDERLIAELREQARTAGKFDAAISAEHKRGQALGFYMHRSESGKPGGFTAGMTGGRDRSRIGEADD